MRGGEVRATSLSQRAEQEILTDDRIANGFSELSPLVSWRPCEHQYFIISCHFPGWDFCSHSVLPPSHLSSWFRCVYYWWSVLFSSFSVMAAGYNIAHSFLVEYNSFLITSYIIWRRMDVGERRLDVHERRCFRIENKSLGPSGESRKFILGSQESFAWECVKLKVSEMPCRGEWWLEWSHLWSSNFFVGC